MDLSDVLDAMATLVADTLIDDDYTIGSIVASKTGDQVRIAVGWPSAEDLDHDLANGITNINIYPTDVMQTETPFMYRYEEVTKIPLTIHGTTTNTTLTLTGTPTTGQLFGIGIGNYGYSVRLAANETLNSALSRLGDLIQGSSVGSNVLTLPNGVTFGNSTYFIADTDTIMTQELGRQTQIIGVWINSPDPFLRNKFGSLIRLGFEQSRAIDVNGATINKPVYEGTHLDDVPENSLLWRRWDRYMVEYPTSVETAFPPVLFAGATIAYNGYAYVTHALFGQVHP